MVTTFLDKVRYYLDLFLSHLVWGFGSETVRKRSFVTLLYFMFTLQRWHEGSSTSIKNKKSLM